MSPLQMSGFVMVKKVPGTLHFHMKQEGMSFAGSDIDVSHFVNEFTFGNRPSPRRRKTLARLHPMGLDRDWADKLSGTGFISGLPETTHEHYLQLVKTTLEPLSNKPGASYDAYEYTVQSHSYVNEMSDVPAAKFTFQTSAMQVRRSPPRAHLTRLDMRPVSRHRGAQRAVTSLTDAPWCCAVCTEAWHMFCTVPTTGTEAGAVCRWWSRSRAASGTTS